MDWMTKMQFLAEQGFSSSPCPTSPEVCLASNTIGTGGSFLWGEARGT